MTIAEPVSGSVVSSSAFGIPVADSANSQITKYAAACSAITTVGGPVNDITGCTVTFTTVNANAFYICWGVFDFSKTANAITGFGVLDVDGVDQSGLGIFSDGTNTIADRASVAQTWVGNLAAGSHTLKLQCFRTGGLGTMNANATHTTITVLVVDK